MPNSQPGSSKRRTLGLIVSDLDQAHTHDIWCGVAEVAQSRGAHVLCLVTGALGNPEAYAASPGRALCDLVDPQVIDGLVTMQWWQSREWFEQVIQRFGDIPVVNCMRWYAGYPGVAMDNRASAYEAVSHLIEEHGYRRIAYAGFREGYAASEARYAGYQAALEEHGLPYNPALVVPLQKDRAWGERGRAAPQYWFDEKQLVPGEDLQAVLAFDDFYAINILQALRERGIRVPYDLALIGFNDSLESRVSSPPLTTVALPGYATGRRAADLLLRLLDDEEVPEQVTVPAPLRLRASCGCLAPTVRQAGVIVPPGDAIALDASARTSILSAMREAMGKTAKSVPTDGEDVLDAFLADLRKPGSATFLPALDLALRRSEEAGARLENWQDVLSAMRSVLLPALYADQKVLRRAEALWHQARALIGAAIQQAQARREAETIRQNRTLHRIGAKLISTFDVQVLMDALAHDLPDLDIPGGYVALYEDPDAPADAARLRLAFDAHGRVDLPKQGQRYPARHWVPAELWPSERPWHLVVHALHFEENLLGFVLFEAGPQRGELYAALQAQISTALQGALLLEARQRAEAALESAYAKVEQEVAARTAELAQSEARFRAIYEGSNDAIMLLTDAGFFDCNVRTLQMFGFATREDFTSVHPADISPPTQPDGQNSFEAAQARIQTAYQDGHNRFEWVHRRQNGEDFPAEVLLSAFDLAGKAVLQATVRDISARKQADAERQALQQQVIDAQQQLIHELSTPIIPVLDRVIVMPLVGSIDSMRAHELMRAMLGGIRAHRARFVILDLTGVPIVDSGVAAHLDKTIQAARLKGAHTIVTGISDAVAETLVDLGIDWGGIETLRDVRSGLRVALARMGTRATDGGR